MTDAEIMDALRRLAFASRKVAGAIGNQFSLTAAIVFVCPSVKDYHVAREALLRARLTTSARNQAEFTSEKHGPEIECFMIDGVEIQLVCHEEMMTKNGTALGATEVGYVYLRGLSPLRKAEG